ncbi:PURA, partial [Cordylochernes scorpioides]
MTKSDAIYFTQCGDKKEEEEKEYRTDFVSELSFLLPNNSGRFVPGGGQRMPQEEQELATKMLQIQSKRFYLDVKQNRRGRFIKVAEVGTAGRKSRLLLAMSTAAEFRDHLTTFSDLYASLVTQVYLSGYWCGDAGPPNPDNIPEDGKLKSEVMVKDNRRYYLDLKENTRGRFLRSIPDSLAKTGALGLPEARESTTQLDERDLLRTIKTQCLQEWKSDAAHDCCFVREKSTVDSPSKCFPVCDVWGCVQVSQTIARGGPRSQIAIPAQGMIEFRDALTDLLEEYNTDEEGITVHDLRFTPQMAANLRMCAVVCIPGFKGDLPEGRHLRVENKNFYFDIGQNSRGIYMRISEVSFESFCPVMG